MKELLFATSLSVASLVFDGCTKEVKEIIYVMPDAGLASVPSNEPDIGEKPTPDDSCNPGERLCYGNKLYRCTAQNQYNLIQDCGESMKCFEEPGVCASIGPDAYGCSEPVVLRFHEGTQQRWKFDSYARGKELCPGDESLKGMPNFYNQGDSLSFSIPTPNSAPQQAMKIFMTSHWIDHYGAQDSTLEVKLDNLSLEPVHFTRDYDCKEYNLSTADLLDRATSRSTTEDGKVIISISLTESCAYDIRNCFGLSQMRVSFCNPEYKNQGEGPSRMEPFCDVGEKKCFDERYSLECTSLGWIEQQDCGTGLCQDNGSCVPLCEEGKYRCDGNMLYHCLNNSWQQEEECRECGECNAQEGKCIYPTEICNGRDDDCNGHIDEDVCGTRTGDPCYLDEQCTTSYDTLCISPDMYPGGYCSQNYHSYNEYCENYWDFVCTAGTNFKKSVCVMDGRLGAFERGWTKYKCVVTCVTEDDCRTNEGYVCKPINDSQYKACLPREEEVTIGKNRDGELCGCGD